MLARKITAVLRARQRSYPSEEAKILIAVKLYEMGRLSTGAVAKFAGVPKPLFLTKLADYGVDTFDLSDEELRRDMTLARRHL